MKLQKSQLQKPTKIKDKQKLNKKQKIKIGKSILMIFVIAVMGVGAFFAGENIPYKTNWGIDFTGGYEVVASVNDWNKPDPSPTNPNGSAKQGLKILKNKLDPIGDKPIFLQTLNSKDASGQGGSGDHYVSVKASKSMYKTVDQLIDATNRNGSLYLIDNNGNDLLVNKDKDKKTAVRTKISDVFKSAKATTTKSKQPIVEFAAGSKWSDLTKSVGKDGKIYFWTDLDEFANNLREDYLRYDVQSKSDAFMNYQLVISYWNKMINSEEGNQLTNIFKYSYIDSVDGVTHSGNFLNDLPQVDEWWSITHSENFKWTYNMDKLRELFSFNPNDTNVNEDNYSKYLAPFEKHAWELLNINQDTKDAYKKYVINYDSITSDKYSLDQSNSFQVASESKALEIQNLVQSGLSGISFNVNYSLDISPQISSTTFLILKIIVLILFIIAGAILTYYFRIFGFLTWALWLLSIVFLVWILNTLLVQFTLEILAAIVISYAVVISGVILFYRRYKEEKVKNNLPTSTALKISAKRTLPVHLDAIIIYLSFSLALFWLCSGVVKSTAIAMIISSIVGLGVIIFTGLLFVWLISSMGWIDSKKILDVPSKGSNKFLFMKKNKKPKVKSEKKVKKLDCAMENNQEIKIVEEAESPSPKGKSKAVRNKKLFYKNFSWYHLFKWVPIVGFILVAIAGVMLAFNLSNVDNTMQNGSVYKINQRAFHGDSATTADEVKYIKTSLNNKNDKVAQKYKSYHISFSEGKSTSVGKIVIIRTSILDIKDQRSFLTWLLKIHGETFGTDSITFYQSKPIMAKQAIYEVLIALAVAAAVFFIYSLFRLDWGQFLSIVITGIFAVVITISIGAISQILISFASLISFILVFVFAVTISTFFGSRLKQFKNSFNEKEFNSYFEKAFDNLQDRKKQKLEYKFGKEILENSDVQKKLNNNKYFSYKKTYKTIIRIKKGKSEEFKNTKKALKSKIQDQKLILKENNLGKKNVLIKLQDFLFKNNEIDKKEAAVQVRELMETNCKQAKESLLEHKKELKLLKNQQKNKTPSAKKMFKIDLKDLLAKDSSMNKKTAKSTLIKIQKEKAQEIKKSKKALKKDIKSSKKVFAQKNKNNNLLYSAADLTIKNLFKFNLYFSILLGLGFLFLALFSGSFFGLYIFLLVGTVLAIWSQYFVAIPIWVYLENKRAINKVKIKRFIASRRVQQDEQIVEGIND